MSGDLADANLQLGRIEESDKWARKIDEAVEYALADA
jgi:hypothetical protein